MLKKAVNLQGIYDSFIISIDGDSDNDVMFTIRMCAVVRFKV